MITLLKKQRSSCHNMDKPEKLEIWDEAKLKLQFPGRVFVNTQEEHYKFWSAQPITKFKYLAYWGRIGKAVQSAEVAGSLERKIREKINKGYREI